MLYFRGALVPCCPVKEKGRSPDLPVRAAAAYKSTYHADRRAAQPEIVLSLTGGDTGAELRMVMP